MVDACVKSISGGHASVLGGWRVLSIAVYNRARPLAAARLLGMAAAVSKLTIAFSSLLIERLSVARVANSYAVHVLLQPLTDRGDALASLLALLASVRLRKLPKHPELICACLD